MKDGQSKRVARQSVQVVRGVASPTLTINLPTEGIHEEGLHGSRRFRCDSATLTSRVRLTERISDNCMSETSLPAFVCKLTPRVP
jgi:hypothetical protein